MTVFVALLLTVLSFAFIVYPLFKRRLLPVDAVEDEKSRELASKRGTTYSMLKELEFDFQSGILTEEDYRDLEARYKRKAISILKDADNLEKGTEVGDEIEKQVQALRRSSNKENNKAGGQHREPSGRKFCTQCGSGVLENDKFCAGCGTSLSTRRSGG
ncbi:zinc-ribbon domain-containing protein [Chloroflexota bacterium]